MLPGNAAMSKIDAASNRISVTVFPIPDEGIVSRRSSFTSLHYSNPLTEKIVYLEIDESIIFERDN